MIGIMMLNKELLFSVTAKDCEWIYTKGSGAGGQKRNKTSSAVHCFHRPSGAHGYSEDGRSQLHNRQDAFKKMAESKQFQTWNKVEAARISGKLADINSVVEEQMKHIKLEIKQNGKWLEINDLPVESPLNNSSGESNESNRN